MKIDSLIENKHYLFWTLQAVGWSGWATSFYLGVVFFSKAPSDDYIWYMAIIACIGMLMTLALRRLYRAMWNMKITHRILAIVIGSYGAGVLWMACRATIFYNMFIEQRELYAQKGMGFLALPYFDGAVSAFWVMLVWSGLYFGIKNYMMLQEEKERGLKAMNMAHEAQLKMLRYQLNPHFLFNTLNAVSTLVLDNNNQLANVMVTRLSRFLRYSLDNDPMQKVTVAEEVAALKLYLDIEKVRFDERLRLVFDIEPEAQQALMPSLLLQPLVENSIKYAIAQAINGGTIAVSAKVFGAELLLTVVDDGPGIDLSAGIPREGGVGLSNCCNRLKAIYGNEQSFHLSTTDPHGLTVNIRIPLQLKEQGEQP